MSDNPYKKPNDSTATQIAFHDPEDVGKLLAEYRVSRAVIWACLLLVVCSVCLCLLVISELFTSQYHSIWKPLSVLAILLVVATASTFAAAAAVRTRLAVFERGIVHCNAIGSSGFRYAEVSDMHVSGTPLANLGRTLNPLKPHLVIYMGSPVAKRYYICPFLISDFGLFETAVNTWSAANRNRQMTSLNTT